MANIRVRTNAINLALHQELIGSTIELEDEDFDIVDFDYDSFTHTFAIENANGDIREISDKLFYNFIVQRRGKLKPNKKRGNKKN